MKTFSLLLFILLFAAQAVYGNRGGLSGWTATTPGGNTMDGDFGGGQCLILKNETSICEIIKYYFYKDHVIGTLDYDRERKAPIAYIIVNESSLKVDTFLTEESWQKAIEQRKLKPERWIRWYRSSWSILGSYEFILIVIPFVSFIWFVYFIAKFVIPGKKVNWNKRLGWKQTVILVILFAGFLILLLHDMFPQSI